MRAKAKITQNVTVGDGYAIVGDATHDVIWENSDNTDVDQWRFTLISAPPGFATPIGVVQDWSGVQTWHIPAANLTGLDGSWFVEVAVRNLTTGEIRRSTIKYNDQAGSGEGGVFSIPNVNGLIKIAHAAMGRHMNLAGNQRAWTTQIDDLMDSVFSGPGGGGLSVAGANGEYQFRSGSALAANDGLRANTVSGLPAMDYGFEISDGVSTATITMPAEAPSANRTIYFPDASTQLIGDDTIDTLTNKTIDTADNLLTTTGQQVGDILVNDGTRWQRLAKGSEGQALAIASGAVTWATIGGGGGTPGGSSGQMQVNSSGAFAGTPGLLYDFTNNQPQAPNGYVITNSGVRLVLQGFPTASTKTITFPNATGTVVLADTVDTLTNKTLNVDNNTLTRTGLTLGDLLKSNGTKFAAFARGGALQVLRVNAAGTDLEWATIGSGLTVAGSSGEVQINNGSGGLGAGTNVVAGANYQSIGASPGSLGFLRFPLGSGSVLIGGKAGAGTNDQIIGASAFNLYFGEVTPANWTVNISGYPLNLWAYSSVNFYSGAGGTTVMQLDSASIRSNVPRLGNSTPYASEGEVTLSAGNETLSAAQYSRAAFLMDTGGAGGTKTFPAPASADASYIKFIRGNSITSGVTMSTGTGSTAQLLPADGSNVIPFIFTTSGVFRGAS